MKADEAYFVPLLADSSTYEPIAEPNVNMVGDDIDPLHKYNWSNGDKWIGGAEVPATA